MIDEWQIQHEDKDLSPETWQFIEDNGFLGLIIPKEFGGLEFSSYAQSLVMSKIASRSPTAAVSCMVQTRSVPVGCSCIMVQTSKSSAGYGARQW